MTRTRRTRTMRTRTRRTRRTKRTRIRRTRDQTWWIWASTTRAQTRTRTKMAEKRILQIEDFPPENNNLNLTKLN